VLLLCGPAQALEPAAPHDLLVETLPGGDTTLVLRYLAPEVAALSYADVAGVLDALCARDGLPAWSHADPPPNEIVIVLMDRAVVRGQADPDATQFISAYITQTGEHCIWQ
jgi:hypothetical protein